jgi:hypothetical protein
MKTVADTLHLALNDSTFNNIKSMNLFIDHDAEYLCIYDENSGSINMYDLLSQRLIKKVLPRKCLPDKRLYKTSVYCKNFDSIFISNNEKKLYMMDSSGIIKDAAKFSSKVFINVTRFQNTTPLVSSDSLIYTSIRPSGLISSIEKAREANVMYRFDFFNNRKVLLYRYPVRYLNHLYGYNFLEYSYCFNNKGHFVFSFPADSNLFETDLDKLHIAHFAKSQWQQGDIMPMRKEDMHNDSSYKQFQIRDVYGAVFFDPYQKRYLRFFKQKISEADFAAKKYDRKATILIFDEDLRIIGESIWPKEVDFKTLFFTKDGGMYARVNRQDENALHFIRLTYMGKTQAVLAQAKQ